MQNILSWRFFFCRSALAATFLGVLLFNAGLGLGKGSTNELFWNFRYENASAGDDSYSINEMQTAYLREYKSIFIGGELIYMMDKYPDSVTTRIELGGLAKYWIVPPGKVVGFDIFGGLSLGKEERADDAHNVIALRTGPEIVFFIGDGTAAVETKLQYSYRRAGATASIMGLLSGFAIFF